MPQLNILLPEDMADYIRSKVASGAYASESEVISESLRELISNESEIESWLRDEVLPTLEDHDRNPESALSGDDVRKSILHSLSLGNHV